MGTQYTHDCVSGTGTFDRAEQTGYMMVDGKVCDLCTLYLICIYVYMYSGATNNNNKMLASRLNLIRAQISKLLPSLKLNKVRTPTLTKLALLTTSFMILPKYIKLAE